jgi:hypothetical protein
MRESIFGEFQYFIRRINAFRNGGALDRGETIEDLEQRFRVQIERGLIIDEPYAQEVAIEILLSDLPEDKKKHHIMELRKTGHTNFAVKKPESKPVNAKQPLNLEQQRERALSLIFKSLKMVGVKVQKQPLGVKMLIAEYELKNVDYNDPSDLKLLLVNTVKISGHAKKANPSELAMAFNKVLAES